MEQRPITWVEVFADGPLRGTLHPVVHDADDLRAPVMEAVARRFRQPETSFVQATTRSGATYRHRIFTVAGEVPFAGHPSLGTAAAVAHRRGDTETTYVQETLSGEQRLDVGMRGGEGTVGVHQNPATFADEWDVDGVVASLGIEPTARDRSLPGMVVTTGLDTLIVPLASVADVSRCRVDRDAFAAALAALPDPTRLNVYVVAESAPRRWRARSFALDMPGGEDPATGSAAGPLGAYLQRYRGLDRIVVDQGVEIGAHSRLVVDTRSGIVVSGGCRIVGSGSHEIPDEAV